MVMPEFRRNEDGTLRLDRDGNPIPVTPDPGSVDLSNPTFRDFLGGTPQVRDLNAIAQGGHRYRTWQVAEGVMGWEVVVWDLRGGLNLTSGDVVQNWDRASSEDGVDNRYYKTSSLSQLRTAAASPDPTGNLAGLHHANIFGTLIMAAGSGANVALIKETSSTNPAPTAITYSPGDVITGLAKVIIGGPVIDERLAVLMDSTATDLLGDASATDDGSFHADTNPGWGMIQTPLNTATILVYSNQRIYTLASDQSVSTAPTAVLTNVPNGGIALGMLQRGGGPLRSYFLWPREDNTSGALVFGSEKNSNVVSVNLEGLDPQVLNFGFPTGVLTAAIVPGRQGIVATDGYSVKFEAAQGPQNLNIFRDRPPDTDKEYRVRGFGIDRTGNDIYALINQIASPNGTGNTKWWFEHYDFDTGAWHQVTDTVTGSTTGVLGIVPAGSFPVSEQTGFLHAYIDGSWHRFFAPASGENPYTLFNRSSGSQASTGRQFASSGTYTSPVFSLPGLEGTPKVVSHILFDGSFIDISSGNNDASVKIDVASQVLNNHSFTNPVSATFNQRDRFLAHRHFARDNRDAFDRLQFRHVITQDSGDTYTTPNALPYTIRGLAFLDGNVRPPGEFYSR